MSGVTHRQCRVAAPGIGMHMSQHRASLRKQERGMLNRNAAGTRQCLTAAEFSSCWRLESCAGRCRVARIGTRRRSTSPPVVPITIISTSGPLVFAAHADDALRLPHRLETCTAVQSTQQTVADSWQSLRRLGAVSADLQLSTRWDRRAIATTREVTLGYLWTQAREWLRGLTLVQAAIPATMQSRPVVTRLDTQAFSLTLRLRT